MNRINGLSDDLLVKILSFLPTKVAISTSILSKRWKYVWTWLPRLEYISSCFERESFKCMSDYDSPLRRFLDRSMPLHKASVIESFRLDLAFAGCKPEDIKVWIFIAGNILLDVPRMVGLPSLKTLQIQSVKLLDGESFRKIPSVCPVLENLLVKLYGGYVNMGMINYLKLEDYNKEYLPSCLIEDLPQLEEAYLDFNYRDVERLIGSITSVKRLWSLLVRLLEDSPNLRELDLFEMDHKRGYMAWWNQWNQPDTVPKCITSSLQTFSWSGYYGIPQDKDIVVYILTNACQLKTLTISSDNIYTPKYEMIKELSLSYRASTTCRLIFVYIVESNSNFTIFVLSPKSRFFLMLL
ncbi:hypothetical protein F2Q69_00025366 [Brassica cretica]|uniref:FBD domain-containing protein n=1 Tax=Brassica cretica TaxID=69181 RepID=A0A8S9QMJ4_BRACR|nr:hypothetical protein F2Q69_00025366 [Brassica cretica]